jgi:hypothetical protein
MTDIENLNLPKPLKVKPSIAKYLDDLEEQGQTIYAFAGASFVESLSYLYLLNKYKSKCFAKSGEGNITRKSGRILGISIPLKINYSKDDEIDLKKQFDEISVTLVNCIKRGEKTIIIPLNYFRGLGGHANMLILRIDKKELEHFEPHGGEYVGNEKLQLSAKKVLLFFVNILNKELKKENLPEVKYTDASQVCPYISGLQELESMSKLPKKVKLEGGGYCAAWSIFFAELCLKNPQMTSSELLDSIYNYLTTKESGPDYLKRVIRGYAGVITEQVNIYLSIFFKGKTTVIVLLNNLSSVTMMKLQDVMNILVDLETYILINPDFNLKKELKKAMKEYRDLTKGKTKEEQIELRRGPNSEKKVQLAYYKKRILQNFEEYKRIGRVSEPIFDSPEEIDRDKIRNIDLLKTGLLHEKVQEERQKREEELMNQPWYVEQKKLKEAEKKKRAATRKQMKTDKTKTQKIK